MNHQTFMLATIILCSLGGWYVLITKYLALKQMIKYEHEELEHIPGIGPPPVSHIPFSVPDDLLPPPSAAAIERPKATNIDKRLICNQACILHLLGFGIVFGVPFLNVLLPSLFWLWQKERHPFLDKQGREVINFQISFSLIQLACLGAGVLFIRYAPTMAANLFAWTKIAKIVFTSGMYLPFNVFTVLPFFWCCIVMIRGAVAAYHGISYKYPASQQFIVPNKRPVISETTAQANPELNPQPNFNAVNFS